MGRKLGDRQVERRVLPAYSRGSLSHLHLPLFAPTFLPSLILLHEGWTWNMFFITCITIPMLEVQTLNPSVSIGFRK